MANLLYDLGALVRDDLELAIPELTEAAGRDEAGIEKALAALAPAYADGSVSQGVYWADCAGRLDLEDIGLLEAGALNTAEVNQALLAHVRMQVTRTTVGLLSDATPDWVGHWRRQLKLDELLHVHIIESELEERHNYPELLSVAVKRLGGSPAGVTFIDRKPSHLNHARDLGLPVITLDETTDYRKIFSGLG